MRFAPRYELIFALDDQAADSLTDSAACSKLNCTSIKDICDRYYESSDAVARSKSKFARRQYRMRRIDQAWNVFLECLNWERGMCSLRQTVVPSSNLATLNSAIIDKSWKGKWFHKKLVKLSLIPSLETHFDRTTWKCDSLDGEIRLTVDRNLQANSIQPASNSRDQAASGVPAASNIVRMNYSVSLPAVCKALIYEFALLPEQPTVLLEIAKDQIEYSANGGEAIATPAIGKLQSQVVQAALTTRREVATCQPG